MRTRIALLIAAGCMLLGFCMGCSSQVPSPKTIRLLGVVGESNFDAFNVEGGPIIENARWDFKIEEPVEFQGRILTIWQLREATLIPEGYLVPGNTLELTVERAALDGSRASETQIRDVKLVSRAKVEPTGQ